MGKIFFGFAFLRQARGGCRGQDPVSIDMTATRAAQRHQLTAFLEVAQDHLDVALGQGGFDGQGLNTGEAVTLIVGEVGQCQQHQAGAAFGARGFPDFPHDFDAHGESLESDSVGDQLAI